MGRETFPSVSSTQIAEAQIASASQVPTAFTLQQPSQTFQPLQPLDSLCITSSQPAALDSADAVLAQLVNVAAAGFGVTLPAPPAQDSIGIEQGNAAIVSTDFAQGDAGARASVGSMPAPIAGRSADSTLTQTAAIPNAAQETVTATDAQEDRDGDNVVGHAARRRDGDQRGVRFNPSSPRPAGSRFRPDTQEFRNAREARLVQFVGHHAKLDTEDSGDRGFEYSAPESRRRE